jgi:hypothetical protein
MPVSGRCERKLLDASLYHSITAWTPDLGLSQRYVLPLP